MLGSMWGLAPRLGYVKVHGNETKEKLSNEEGKTPDSDAGSYRCKRRGMKEEYFFLGSIKNMLIKNHRS